MTSLGKQCSFLFPKVQTQKRTGHSSDWCQGEYLCLIGVSFLQQPQQAIGCVLVVWFPNQIQPRISPEQKSPLVRLEVSPLQRKGKERKERVMSTVQVSFRAASNASDLCTSRVQGQGSIAKCGGYVKQETKRRKRKQPRTRCGIMIIKLVLVVKRVLCVRGVDRDPENSADTRLHNDITTWHYHVTNIPFEQDVVKGTYVNR